jgi:small subunit ribosomal protein S6
VKLYETTFILDPELKDEGWESAITKYSGIITSGGSIKTVYRWGLRRMAYEILKRSHGYYVHIIHESESAVPSELERQFKLDESCLRYMTVLADNPRYLEEMEKSSSRPAGEEDSRPPTDDSGDDDDDDSRGSRGQRGRRSRDNDDANEEDR